MNYTKFLTVFWTLALMFTASFVIADVPNYVNYQGRITNSVGNPITDTVTLTFTIYNDSAGPVTIWTETHPAVNVVDGLFDVKWGWYTFLHDSVFNNDTRWLGIKVRSDAEISPQTRLITVPYAFRAKHSDTAGVALSGPAGNSGWSDDGTTVRLTTASDNVGIGLSSPTEKLDVQGNIHASGTIKSGNSITINGVTDEITATGGVIGFDDEDLETSGDIRLGNTSGIAGDIKLGIRENVGTVSPFIRLYVEQSMPSDLLNSAFEIYNPGYDYTPIKINAAGAIIQSTGSKFGKAGTVVNQISPDADEFTYLNAGNVGIGTDAPENKFHVVGSDTQPILNVEQNGSGRGARFRATTACALWVENAGNHGIRISNAGNNGIHVENAGGYAGYFAGSGYFRDNVGIGILGATEKLQVAGTIHSTAGGFKFPDGSVQTSASVGGSGWNWTDSSSFGPDSVGFSDTARFATHAETADMATHSATADTSSYAFGAELSIFSDTAVYSGQALMAEEANYAMTSDTANYAHNSPGFELPYDASIGNSSTALNIANTGPSSGSAIGGRSDENDGIVGWTGISGKSGVYGYSTEGTGVSGRSEGEGNGVYGETGAGSSAYSGVKGFSTGAGPGVYGEGDLHGVVGVATNSTYGIGVEGGYYGSTGFGGHFTASVVGATALRAIHIGGGEAAELVGDVRAIDGILTSTNYSGEAGYFSTDLLGDADLGVIVSSYIGPKPPALDAVGIHSVCITEDSTGIAGYFLGGSIGIKSELQPLKDGWYYNVLSNIDGSSNSEYAGSYYGFVADIDGAGNDANRGVFSMVRDARTNIGGDFYAAKGPYVTADFNYGVYSRATIADSNNYGVYSEASFGDTCFGLYTVVGNGNYNCGLYSSISYGTGYAGIFDGHLSVIGNIYGVAKYFRIDHPLDPENKYLYHSSVESPDMKTVYDGVITLDNNGTAVVQLPDYFEALNKDFRYQLTCIGGYAQVYIENEIANNEFMIAGGKPGMKVSWMVTGIRQDAYAQNNRKQNVEDKPESERGLYLNPEAFGYGNEQAIYKNQPKDVPGRIDPDNTNGL